MISKWRLYSMIIIILFSFNSCQKASRESETVVIADSDLLSHMYAELDLIQKKDPLVNIEALGLEMKDKLPLSLGSQKNKVLDDVYTYGIERTLVVSRYIQGENALKPVLTHASGALVSTEGYVLTNYHVIEDKGQGKTLGFIATDYQGNVYPVDSIVGYSKRNDFALLKIRNLKDRKFDFFPIDENGSNGSKVFVMGHPFDRFFTLSTGLISRTYRRGSPELRQTISAEFGQGSSGGPVFSPNGELCGIVSGTYMHYAHNQFGKEVQLIEKQIIPISEIKKSFSFE